MIYLKSILCLILFISSSDLAPTSPLVQSSLHASNRKKQLSTVLQKLDNKYPIPKGFLPIDPQNTKYHDLGDGSVVAYGQRVQLVNLPLMGVNRLVPITLQYAVRIPDIELNALSPSKPDTISNKKFYSHEGKSEKEDFDINGPTPPNLDGLSGSLNLLPLIDNRLLKVLKESEGHSFDAKPSLGQVPVVRPGNVRPFALFWYLPVNPQIVIDKDKVIKDNKRVHNPLPSLYHNPIANSNLHNDAKPIYRPPHYIPVSTFSHPNVVRSTHYLHG